MAHSIASPMPPRHPLSLDTDKRRMAKADVKILDLTETDWMRAVGGAIRRAIAIVGWSDKEAAGRIGVDAGEFSKWLSGERRPQFDKLFAVKELQQPLVICLAALANGRAITRIEFPEAVNQ